MNLGNPLYSLLGTGLLLDSAMEIDFAKRAVEIR
jgi:hypothetical protein